MVGLEKKKSILLNVGKKHKNKKLVVLKKEIKKSQTVKKSKRNGEIQVRNKNIYKYTKPNNKKQHKHDGRKYRYLLSLSLETKSNVSVSSLFKRVFSLLFLTLFLIDLLYSFLLFASFHLEIEWWITIQVSERAKGTFFFQSSFRFFIR